MLSIVCYGAGLAALLAALNLFLNADRQAHANTIRDRIALGVFFLLLGLALPQREPALIVAICLLGWAVCTPRVGE